MAALMKQYRFAICINNDGYEASLEFRKVYDVLEDLEAESHGFVRVVDESGEDYLFPEDFFIPIELPSPISSQISKPV
jgi:hypothetical protein